MIEIDISGDQKVQGSNASGMRERNERLVLTILRQQGALPKAEIARRTGLSAQTVSVIMRALEQDGLLEKGEKLRGKVGQPSVPMRLASDGALFFGCKVGRRSTELVLVNFIGQITDRRRVVYDFPTPEKTLDFLQTAITEISENLSRSQLAKIAGLGIASPFFLWEWATVIGVDPSQMAGWRDFDLARELSSQVDFPVYSGNDATCACGAELVFGDAAKPKDFLYLYLGYFIGGGVVLNGGLYTGASGNAGAIGPFPSRSADGTQKQLVDVASLVGLERGLAAAGEDPLTLWETPEELDINGPIVSDWLGEATPAIAQMILSTISVIDFPCVIIDGFMPDTLRARVVEQVNDTLLASDLSGLIVPDIRSGSIGMDARPLGAASLPLSKRFMLAI